MTAQVLGLTVQAGSEAEAIRALETLIIGNTEMAKRMNSSAAAKVAKAWKTLEKWTFLKPEPYHSLSRDEMDNHVRAVWHGFVENDLPRTGERVSAEKLSRLLST